MGQAIKLAKTRKWKEASGKNGTELLKLDITKRIFLVIFFMTTTDLITRYDKIRSKHLRIG